MTSVTTQAFRRLSAEATKERQNKMRRAFRLWILDPNNPSLRFKKVHNSMPIDSARVDLDWRNFQTTSVFVWTVEDPGSRHPRPERVPIDNPGSLVKALGLRFVAMLQKAVPELWHNRKTLNTMVL